MSYLCQQWIEEHFSIPCHIRLYHADDRNFRIQCSLQNCSRTYRNFTTYRNHIYNFHGSVTIDDQIVTNSDRSEGLDDDGSVNMDEESQSDLFYHSNYVSLMEHSSSDLQKVAATWILKSRETPLSVMDSLIMDIQSLFDVSLCSIRSRIHSVIQEVGLDDNTAGLIMAEVAECSSNQIFRGLSTQPQQMQFFRSHFGLVVSLNCKCYTSTNFNNYMYRSLYKLH